MAVAYSDPIRTMTAEQSSDGTKIYLTETTGSYNITTNPHGWGAPGGLAIGSVTNATVVFTNMTTNTNYEVVTYPTLPTTSTTTAFTVNYGDIGGVNDTVIADAVWAIRIKTNNGVNGLDETLNTTAFYMVTMYNAKCCVKSKMTEISLDDCQCDSTAMTLAIDSWYWLEAAEAAACSGYVTRAKNILALVNRLCGNADCGCT